MPTSLNAQQQQLYQHAKEASERKNHDYVIKLLSDLIKEVPDHLEMRRLLRANELVKFRASSGFSQKAAGIKTAGLSMKGKSTLKKSPQEALNLAEEILMVDPGGEAGNQLLAEAALAMNLPDVAILAYETLRDANPGKVDVLKQLGTLYLAHGYPEKAQRTFDAAIKIAPNDGEALKGMKDASAMHASASGSWEEGSDYRKSLKNADEARALEREGRVVKSEDAINEELTRLYEEYNQNQSNLNVVKKIADLMERKNDFENALQWFQYAYQLSNQADPELEKRIYKMEIQLVELGIQAKQHELNAADESTRETVEAELAELRRQKAEFELRSARERVQRYPNDKGLRYDLGRALYETGSFQEAVPELQQAINQPNVRIKALNVLGLCYQQRSIHDLAIKQFETAKSEMLTMDALKKEITYNLGLAQERAGRTAEALNQFKEIYEVDYHYRDVAKRVESAYGG